jgi:hypothetical protein
MISSFFERKIWKTAGFLVGLTLLFAAFGLSAQTIRAQDTKPNLCSGSNLDLGADKRSCISDDGKPAGAGNVCGRDSNGRAIPCSDSALNNLITQVINIFSIIVGVIAVIMIIYGGFRYITSGGDSGKIGEAKNTIVFALVGLVIVALAQFIVKFVLNRISQPTP